MSATINNFKLRLAVEGDIPLILSLIKELAAYEKLSDQLTATEEDLKESLFKRKAAEVVMVEDDGRSVGYALFFYNFSTFLGKPGLYIEDLYVKPEMRGRGLGKMILTYLARLAVDRKCGRVEWACLNWNQPAMAFYQKLGARPMKEWTDYRLTGDALTRLAGTAHSIVS